MLFVTLFLVAFASATLLPLGSEALFLYDMTQTPHLLGLWFVATLGNTLGSFVNYLLGLKGGAYLLRRGYLSKRRFKVAKEHFRRYGVWILLLAWVPIVGDPLTFMAGVLRYGYGKFLLLVALSKGLRYATLIFLYFQL